MTTTRGKLSLLLLLAALVYACAVTTPALAADTEKCSPAHPELCGDTGDDDSGDDPNLTSGNKTAPLVTPTKSCSVYANGAGMGMYCTTFGGADTKTLRERYGKQKLQACRYSEIPPTIEKPYNANKDQGRFMLMSCLGDIDFDTYSGGPKKTLTLSVVFVENGTDIEDRHNGITDFLWNQFNKNAQMPVPFMVTRPNVVPLVGIPTYFTFRWLDPATKDVVAEGKYAGRANGGPFRQITEGGVIMRATGTKITVNPRQQGIKTATCTPDTPYREGASPAEQPADACKITFDRSSASARKYATKPIPANIKDAFYADVEVTWQVTYGAEGDPMKTLGNGFTLRLRQVLPVQEVQAPNQPPSVIY